MSHVAESHYQKGRQCVSESDYYQAITWFTECLALDPTHLDALAGLGLSYQRMSRVDQALVSFNQALRLQSNNPEFLLGIGNCYSSIGSVEQAASFYEQVLSVSPGDVRAMFNLVSLKTYAPDAPLVQRLEQLHHSQAGSGHARALIAFALARVLESNGDVLKSFHYYSEANDLQFGLTRYDEEGYNTIFSVIRSHFSEATLKNFSEMGNSEARPIFVLGMPRSGTSLIEQILASHPQVFGAGEAFAMTWIAERVIPQLSGIPFPYEMTACLSKDVIATLADTYLHKMSEYTDRADVRIVDKLPNNYFTIGLISILFPKSSIIHCVRDPMDTCWSMYKQYFGMAHPYCYNLSTLGRYYRQYMTLMKHWHDCMPGRIYQIQYEQLVENPRETVRDMLNYCKLPWDEDCMNYHKNKRVVNTASSRQVRRPIYKTSLKSWEPVRNYLEPLREALELSSK